MSVYKTKEKNFYVLETPHFQYVIEPYHGMLKNLYWGEKLLSPTDLPDSVAVTKKMWDADRYNPDCYNSEFTGWGSKFYHHPNLKATFSDGVRDLDLKMTDIVADDAQNRLTVTLRDTVYPLEVELRYQLYTGLDIIDRSIAVRNLGEETIRLEQVGCGTLNLPNSDYWQLTSLNGCWAKEYEISHQPVTQAPVVLESRCGVSNALHFPYFALDRGNATEVSGEVWFGTMQWSGNWKITVEMDINRNVRVTGGLNDFDFVWNLKGGEEFVSPTFTVGYSAEGFSGASRTLHDYTRKTTKATAWANKPLPVLFNSWTSFEFDIDEEKAMALAEKAADLGIELFVIDDGWFAGRNDETTSLGDWYPSPTKFPNGLDPLIKRVNELGMMFGIWVEPEMVDPVSELYEKHPDWVINFPTREREVSRNQLILNLAREDVYQFVIAFLDDLLSKHSIGYLKWDMNRWFSQPGWPEKPSEEQQELWVRYVQNFYRVFEFLNEKYPNVILENCSSGGLRSDLTMSKWCSRINRCDNQDPLDELYLHEGFTYVNLSRSAGGAGHISANHAGLNKRECPMEFKAHIAMMGSMGIGIDLRKLTPDEYEELRGYIKMQKELRETVQMGDMYRLKTMSRDRVMAVEFVAKDKHEAVLFLFGPQTAFIYCWPELKLCGLQADARYDVEGFGTFSGDTLMKFGLPRGVHTLGNMSSKLIRIRRIDAE